MEPIEINSNSRELKRGFYEFKAYEPQIVGYAGKIVNGKPTFTKNIKLPENTDIIIVIDATKTQTPASVVEPDHEIKLDEIREE